MLHSFKLKTFFLQNFIHFGMLQRGGISILGTAHQPILTAEGDLVISFDDCLFMSIDAVNLERVELIPLPAALNQFTFLLLPTLKDKDSQWFSHAMVIFH
ncbi:hypothetical protein HHK36_012596 [Tetracentron sinense]|uniref:Uncharacterized protein n=1 Tax=Tetracentron sinense TaxID=13715 RepID=A0A834Z9K5_TETSI|nr:hypothetical protein HHK36_012596 [Tetracentron sinense]